MKKNKSLKSFATICALVLLTSVIISSSVYAAERGNDISEAERYLLDIGTPEDVVKGLSDSQVNEIYQSLSNSSYDITFGKVEEFTDSENSINENDFTLSALYYNLAYEGEVFQAQIFVDYSWVNLPSVINTDAIVIEWDDDILSLDGASLECFAETFTGTICIKEQYEPDVFTKNSVAFAIPLSHAQMWWPMSYSGLFSLYLTLNNYPAVTEPETCNIPITYTHLEDESSTLEFVTNGNKIDIVTVGSKSSKILTIPYNSSLEVIYE